MNRDNLMRRRDILAGCFVAGLSGIVAPAAVAAGALPRHIVDCQGHVWLPGPKKPSPTERQTPLSYDELLGQMDKAGVERLVIVTPSWNPTGNAYPLEAAQKHPDRFRVMGLYDVTRPPDPSAIADWLKPKGMVGMRIFLGSPAARKWLAAGEGEWLWQILDDHAIPLSIFAGGQMPEIAKIAAKHPHLAIALDSFGVPTDTIGLQAFDHYDEVLDLAKYPNVSIKVESVPFLSGEAYPYRNLFPIMKRTFDAFGPRRMFWGSDFTLLKGSYRDCVTFMTQMNFLSNSDLEWIMGRSIANWLRWPLPA